MRSLLLVCNLHPKKLGTFERYLAEVGRRGRSDGVRVGLMLSGEPIPEVAALFQAEGLKWWAFPDWVDGSDRERRSVFVRAYTEVLRQGPWDVAVFQFCNELSVATATLIARLRSLAPPASVWVQHSQMVPPGRITRRLSRIRLLKPFVNGMILLSEGGRSAMCGRGWPRDRSTVIPNGIPAPAPRFRGRLRPELGLPPTAVVLLCVGSLIPRKGYDLLLPAVAPHLSRSPDHHLIVAGDGPQRQELTELAGSLGVGGKVHFLGLRNDVPELLADADLFVLASRAEGLTLAVVEAMAAGLPVVVTDVGGHSEVVTAETGWLVPPADVSAFRTAVGDALIDRSAAARRGAAGREQVLRSHSLAGQVEAQFRYFAAIWSSRRMVGDGIPVPSQS